MRAFSVALALIPSLAMAQAAKPGKAFNGVLGAGLCLQLKTSAGAASIKWCATGPTEIRFKSAAGTEFAALSDDGFLSIDNWQPFSNNGPLTLWPNSTGAASAVVLDDQGAGTGPLLSVQRSEVEKAAILPAGTFQSKAASGAKAFEITTSGARFDFGAGASDYASSDGTTVTFAGPIAASNLSGTQSGTNTGDVTIATANGLSLVGQALSMAAAGSSTTGAVTSSTQTFGGVKTFSSTATFSQGLTIPTAWSLSLNAGGDHVAHRFERKPPA